jgi:transposase
MFLRCTTRKKNGKEHRYWNLVENRRVAGGQVVQRQVLYLGEINDSQCEVWRKSIEVFEDGRSAPRTVALFAEEQTAPLDEEQVIQVRLKDLAVRNARQWGGCWLVCELYEQLKLDQFWAERLPPGRKGTRWDLILQTLCIYRFIEPGSEWRLHRYWFDRSAVPELLGSDFRLAESHRLYECHDLLLKHKGALFTHLTERWKDLFNAKFDILLYDLTSTYFECDPPIGETDKRKFGHSRDKRSDCVQVVIALIVTPEGFPLAYEVLAGNTSDKTTLRDFLKKIEAQYGKAERTWVLDRGIPTEEVLAEMRNSEPPIYYLVGTPKSRLSKLEAELIGRPWEQVRPGLDVKLLAHEGELYVQAQSQDRVSKERAMRQRRLRKLWNRLCELQKMKLNTKALLIKIGEAKKEAGRAFGLIDLKLPNPGRSKKRKPKTERPKGKKPKTKLNFSFRVNRAKFRETYRREGQYLLRGYLAQQVPAKLWEYYTQLTEIEEAFKNLKGDLGIRPIFHQLPHRIEAHIFIAFLTYCLHVTLRRRLRDLAPGLTPRAVLEKFSAMQMIDVHLPTSDGRTIILSRYTQPEADLQLLLKELKLELPDQPPPKITASGQLAT